MRPRFVNFFVTALFFVKAILAYQSANSHVDSVFLSLQRVYKIADTDQDGCLQLEEFTSHFRHLQGFQGRMLLQNDASSPAVCASTCYDKTCEAWLETQDNLTCANLETDYGCDCSGCALCESDTNATSDSNITVSNNSATGCASTCLEETCDVWMGTYDYLTCEDLQSDYGCDCTGCTLCEDSHGESTNDVTPPSPPSPPPYPPAPPLMVIGPVAYIETPHYSQEHLIEAVGDERITTIVLRVDVWLQNFPGLDLSRSLEVRGECVGDLCVIDGGQRGPMFILDGAENSIANETKLILSNLVLTNFRSQENGGVVHARSANTTIHINNCDLYHNSALNGGVVYAPYSGNINITGSSILQNTAEVNGGAVDAGGSGAITIADSALRDNNAEYGGVVNVAGGVDVIIARSNMAHNLADSEGGVVMRADGGGDIVVTGSNMLQNLAPYGGVVSGRGSGSISIATSHMIQQDAYGGGVVHFDGSGDITIADSYMTLNLVADKGCVAFARGSCGIAITGSVMVNNTAFLEGGVVCVAGGGDITITDSIMTNNSARNGGVAYGGEGGIVITDSIMTQNAANNGGVVYQDSNVGGFISISGSNMTRNFAGSFGAVAYFSPVLELISAISITDSHMAQHSAGYGAIYGELDTTLTDSIFTHNSAEVDGGVAHVGANLVIIGSNLSQNSAMQYGGVAYLLGDTSYSLTIARSNLTRNSAKIGGAVFIYAYEVMIDNSCLGYNTAFEVAGGMKFEYSNVTIRESSMYKNEALESDGGALESVYTSLTISGSSCIGNSAGGQGGCLHSVEGHVDVDNTTFTGNAAMYGGAVSVLASTLKARDGTVLESNQATVSGGGLYCTQDATVHALANISVSSNLAELGGGIFIGAPCSVQFLVGGVIRGNTATKEGGGVVLQTSYSPSSQATLYAQHLQLDSNQVMEFAGGGMSASSHSVVELRNARLTNNIAQNGNGGAIYAVESRILVADFSVLTENVANGNGGAAFLINSVTFELDSSEITANVAREKGGGLEVRNGSALTISNNSRISRNVAVEGAAINSIAADLSLAASVIQGNSASARTGGVRLYQGSVLEMEAVAAEGQQGSALLVGDGSYASINTSHFTANAAAPEEEEASGALLSERGSSVVLHQCRFEGNSGPAAAAAHLSGNVTIAQSNFTQNAASTYAPVYIHLQGDVVLDGLNFWNNSGVNGGAMYLVEASNSTSESSLHHFTKLHFEWNAATKGGSVAFWDPLDQFANASWPPACLECSYHNNTASYTTEDGWAGSAMSLRVDPRHSEERGEYPFDVPIIGEVVDGFGTVVTEDIQVFMSATCPVSGEVKRVARDGVVVFEDLVLSGAPGSGCSVQLSATLDGTEVTASTVVPLRVCRPGESYDPSAQRCDWCAETFLSMTNDTKECFACGTVEGITCPGGSSYEILNGYWLAPVAESCEDTECLMECVYPCDHAAACSTNGTQRGGTGFASVGRLELCALEDGFTSGVLCGGTSTVVCARGYYASVVGDDCHSCPGHSDSLWRFVAAAISLVILYMGAATYMLHQTTMASGLMLDADLKEEFDMMQEFGEMVTELAELTRVSRVIGFLFGYIQVVGQFTNIFSVHLVPDVLTEFLSVVSIINVDVGSLSFFVNMECASHHISSNLSSFEAAFVVTTCAPLIVVAINGCLFWMYSQYLRHKHQKVKAAQLELMVSKCFYQIASLTLFLLTLMHPTVSTMAVQVFNCNKYWYTEQEAIQSWLDLGSDTECHTRRWGALMMMSLVTITSFILGFPVGVFVFMYRSRRWVKCRLRRGDVRTHWQWLQQHGCTCAESSLGYELDVGSLLCEDESVKTRPVEGEPMAADSNCSPQSGFKGLPQFTPPIDDAPLSSIEAIATGHIENDSQDDYIDMLIRQSLVAHDKGIEGNAAGNADAGHVERGGTGSGEALVATMVTLRLSGADTCSAYMYQKKDAGDHGAVTLVPVTSLDATYTQQVLGAGFLNPFEDCYYFWQCYEICRRFLQTGGILLVTMLFDTEAGVAFALFLSVVALCNHLLFRPYSRDADDFLMMAILANQFVCHFFFFCLLLSDKHSEAFGAIMVSMQVGVVMCAFTLMFPDLLLLMTKVAHSESVQQTAKKVEGVSRRFSQFGTLNPVSEEYVGDEEQSKDGVISEQEAIRVSQGTAPKHQVEMETEICEFKCPEDNQQQRQVQETIRRVLTSKIEPFDHFKEPPDEGSPPGRTSWMLDRWLNTSATTIHTTAITTVNPTGYHIGTGKNLTSSYSNQRLDPQAI
ncbi:hypothetical protein CYMTET_36303 [Cymbomonas tetramitiformis]|uniref:EF-hand domain-containing protein n=1 Tax=Cymbomonas tetramitiformis TaxID=36881 RepID=A0AAE0F743_9CHLO|nr:hypothetical protein CYMTET_36303 [Cymbomonas tetramitiformis]